LEMRRHYANYFKGLPHFKDERTALVTMANPEEIEQRLFHIQDKYHDYSPGVSL